MASYNTTQMHVAAEKAAATTAPKFILVEYHLNNIFKVQKQNV